MLSNFLNGQVVKLANVPVEPAQDGFDARGARGALASPGKIALVHAPNPPRVLDFVDTVPVLDHVALRTMAGRSCGVGHGRRVEERDKQGQTQGLEDMAEGSHLDVLNTRLSGWVRGRKVVSTVKAVSDGTVLGHRYLNGRIRLLNTNLVDFYSSTTSARSYT